MGHEIRTSDIATRQGSVLSHFNRLRHYENTDMESGTASTVFARAGTFRLSLILIVSA